MDGSPARSSLGTGLNAAQRTSVGFDRELAVPPRPFTLFAPTNDAFAAMSEEELAEWQDELALPSLIAYHAVDADEGGTPVAFDRYGTVRDARGLTSSTYTVSSLIANCAFINPTTFRARAMRRV